MAQTNAEILLELEDEDLEDFEEEEAEQPPPPPSTPRSRAAKEKHDREFQEFLELRSQAWNPVWKQGRVLYEQAQEARLQEDYSAVLSLFREILDLQATARATFARLIQDNPHKDPGGGCCRPFELDYETFVTTIEYQLAHPLTEEQCQAFFADWNPWRNDAHRAVTERERTYQKRKVLAFYLAGGCVGYSDTVELVYTTRYEDYMDGSGYRWGMKPLASRELYFHLAPPDARGTGYFLAPWGDQVGAWLDAHLEACCDELPKGLSTSKEWTALDNLAERFSDPTAYDLEPWKALALEQVQQRRAVLNGALPEPAEPQKAQAQESLFCLEGF